METYTFLRELADSYVMAILLTIFLGVVAFAFRPGSRPIHDDAANVPFRHDAGPGDAPKTKTCTGICADCAVAPLESLKEYGDV